jgi:hypothetical protein
LVVVSLQSRPGKILDKLGTLISPLVPLAPVLGVISLPENNRMHFLAGRRAWYIGRDSLFGLSNDVTVLETAAVERFSSQAFNIADSVIGLEKRVPDVWYAFLDNFIHQMSFKPVDQVLKPRWKRSSRAVYSEMAGSRATAAAYNNGRAVHIGLSFSTQLHMTSDPEFQDANRLYSRLLPSR